jgi:hypothetical protein
LTESCKESLEKMHKWKKGKSESKLRVKRIKRTELAKGKSTCIHTPGVKVCI